MATLFGRYEPICEEVYVVCNVHSRAYTGSYPLQCTSCTTYTARYPRTLYDVQCTYTVRRVRRTLHATHIQSTSCTTYTARYPRTLYDVHCTLPTYRVRPVRRTLHATHVHCMSYSVRRVRRILQATHIQSTSCTSYTVRYPHTHTSSANHYLTKQV